MNTCSVAKNPPSLNKRVHIKQYKNQSVMPPACTDASTTQNAPDEAIELSVHAGDTSEHKIWLGEGQQQ